jgi:hypothetical protein
VALQSRLVAALRATTGVTPVSALLTPFLGLTCSLIRNLPRGRKRKVKKMFERLLFCPECGEIVEPQEGEGGFRHYYCEDCESFVSPVSNCPEHLREDRDT